MTYGNASAAVLAACASLLSAAQSQAAAAAAAAEVTTEAGKITYPAAYFAAQRPNTAWEMIDRLPGFTFDGGDQVRGFAGAAGNVVIDGERPTSKGEDLVSILRRIPADQVDRIEVIRGGAPGVDMHGKPVLANVVRRKSGGFHGDVNLGLTTVEDGRALPQTKLDGSWERNGTRIEAGLQFARFIDDGSTSGKRFEYDADHKILDSAHMSAKAGGWQDNGTVSVETPAGGGKLKVNLFLQDQPYRATSADNFVVAGPDLEIDTNHQTDGEVGAHWERTLGSAFNLELIGLAHEKRDDSRSSYMAPGDDELFTLNAKSKETIARTVLHWTPRRDFTVEGGGEYAVNTLNSRTDYKVNSVDQALPAANVQVREDRAEPFVTVSYKPLPQLSVETGLKAERSTLTARGDVVLGKTLTYLKPRLLVSWSPTANDQVRVRIEREVGQLDFGQFVATSSLNTTGVQAGNPNLVPQKDWAAELALEHRFWGKGAVSLTARRLQLEDVIDRRPITDPGCSATPGQPHYRPDCPAGGQPASVYDEAANIGGGVQNELLANLTLPLDRLRIPGGTLKVGGKWRTASVADPTTGERRSISGLHQQAYQIDFVQDLPTRNLSWGMGFNGGWKETYYRFNEIDTYGNGAWLSLWTEYKPKADTSLRAGVDNAGRRIFQITRVIYNGPRNLDPTPAYIDYQRHESGLEFTVRLRKSFG